MIIPAPVRKQIMALPMPRRWKREIIWRAEKGRSLAPMAGGSGGTFNRQVAIAQKPASTTQTFDVTTGFAGDTPLLAILWCVSPSTTAEDAITSGAGISLAFSDGTNHWGGSVSAKDNVATSVDKRRHDTKFVVLKFDGTTFDQATVAFTANTVTLTWGGSVAGPLVHLLALGGSDFAHVAVGNFTADTTAAPHNQDITSLGWQPTFGMILSTGSATAPPATNNSAEMACYCWNATDGSGWSMFSLHNNVPATGNNETIGGATYFELFTAKATVITNQGHCTGSFLSNGFRLAWAVTPSAAYYIGYLMLAGTFLTAIKNGQAVTATGDTTFSGFGIVPLVVLCNTLDVDLNDVDQLCIGASTGAGADVGAVFDDWPKFTVVTVQNCYEESSATYLSLRLTSDITSVGPPTHVAKIKIATAGFGSDGSVKVTADALTVTTNLALVVFGEAAAAGKAKLVEVNQAVNRANSW